MTSTAQDQRLGGAAALQAALRERIAPSALAVLTDNHGRIVSCATRGGVTTVRLHRRFAHAPGPVLDAVAALATGRGEAAAARAVLRRWWRDGASEPAAPDGGGGEAPDESGDGPEAGPSPRRRDGPADPAGVNAVGAGARGTHHDLAVYALHLNETYLDGRSRAAVRWGPRARRRGPTRSIRLGCFFPGQGRILMNRRLDREDVPRYFIEYVLFHEMLHEVLGIGERPDGRRDIHGSLFKLMERTYPDVDRALAFERRYFGG